VAQTVLGRTAAARLLDPAVLARIGSLELLARTVVDGFVGGLHRSAKLGVSTDFAEHRAYLPGDDTRYIDWRLYARTDRLHVKTFEADTNTSAVALLDVSRSMGYASGAHLTKLDYGRFLAASLLWLSHRQGDRVGLATFDDRVRDFVPPAQRHLPMALHALDRARAGGPGELEAPLRAAADVLRRRGVLAVISDFYAEPATAVDAVLRLRQRGSELLVFHLLDPAERELPFQGPTSVRDLESEETLPLIPDALRAGYRQLVDGHVAELARRFAARGVDYTIVDTSAPLDHALARYLAGRQRLARVR
jgi:uncharacterized protein (DUF58 family)